MNGVLLVDKPIGPSSHRVVSQVRRQLAQKRVGHAGTLDPAASGLLVLGVGGGTRLLTFMVGLDKDYRATFRLGIGTDTDDAEGHAIARPGCPPDAPVAEALNGFRGRLQQRPASVSAVKVDGRRAYARVRAGEEVELPAREVTVSALQLLAVNPTRTQDGIPVVDLDVTMSVSSGTFVRSIARDLGTALGSAGHVTALRRTRVGPFDVDQAVALDEVTADHLLSLGEAAGDVLPTVTLDGPDAAAVLHGSRLPCERPEPTTVALLDPHGELVSVASCDEGRWRHHMVVPSPQQKVTADGQALGLAP